jgi:large subunit ribosomal protein L9
MKVILKDEVINLGLPGEVVDVADGYGRNYLIPRGIAMLATKGAMREAELLVRARKAHEANTIDQAHEFKQVLESRTLRVPARVDEGGHLYGSVNVNDVHRVLKERGHEIDKRRIDLRGNIKMIGEYEVPIQVHPQVTAVVTVEVVDTEGNVKLKGGTVQPDVDEEAVADVAADAAEGSQTDPDVLAEQALQAATEYEKQRQAAEASEEAAEVADEQGGTDEDVPAES